MDDFDRFWQWANKPNDSRLTIRPTFITQLHRCRRRPGATAPRSTRPRRETGGGNTALRRP